MIYDVLVIGGGPAGIAAAIYAKRAGRNVAIIEKFLPGGQLGLIGEIENYPGFESINGNDLAQNFYNHAAKLNIPFILREVVDVDFSSDIKKIILKSEVLETCSVIIAIGSHNKELNIEGEKEFKGKGVSYCALCDGNFFKNKTVAVVGSGDSAFSDCNYLSPICQKVYLLSKNNFRVQNYNEDELNDKENIEILKGALSSKIEGNDTVNKLYYEKNGETFSIDVDGVFVAIGRSPSTSFLKDKIKLDERGYIYADEFMKTSQDGVFVCGDVRKGSICQIATCVGEGAIAGTEASKYVLKNFRHK